MAAAFLEKIMRAVRRSRQPSFEGEQFYDQWPVASGEDYEPTYEGISNLEDNELAVNPDGSNGQIHFNRPVIQ